MLITASAFDFHVACLVPELVIGAVGGVVALEHVVERMVADQFENNLGIHQVGANPRH